MLSYLEFKNAECKDCYKCLRECPVKAIEYIDRQAQIIDSRCILCGKCTEVCPQNAKRVHTELPDVKRLLASESEVVASVAPSFVSSFGMQDFSAMKIALGKLGFADAEETAVGARAVTAEYEKLLKTGKFKNFITSACPAVNRMIQLYYPEALQYLAPVDSPMLAHAKMIKAARPNAKVVFIGPCASKKLEASRRTIRSDVDFVLTFEELSAIFEAKNIDVETIECEEEMNDATGAGRGYAVAGGVAGAIEKCIKEYYPGVEANIEHCESLSECSKMLMLAKLGKKNGCLIEGMACPGGCVAGAGTNIPVGKAAGFVKKAVENSAEAVPPKELEEINLD